MAKKKKIKIHEVKKLPKNPIKGDYYEREVDNPYIGKRLVTFKATGKKGFGKYRIIENVPA